MLDLLAYQDYLKTKVIEGKMHILDPVRKKPILLTPEEMVRQLTIQYLHLELGYPLGRFSVEKQIKLHETIKRYDIVIFDKQGNPFILVECKRPEIVLDQKVCDQIARYNLVLKVPYLMITNGPSSFFFDLDYEVNDFNLVKILPRNGS